MSENQAEMPRYQCHKKVWALKIAKIRQAVSAGDVVGGHDVGGVITPADEGYHPFTVDQEFMDRHKPVEGGYYVVYEDGYASFSPAIAFEQGYTRIE